VTVKLPMRYFHAEQECCLAVCPSNGRPYREV